MTDSLSRFDVADPLDAYPGLASKLTRAVRSHAGSPVKLTAEEAAYLIQEGGGPDPDRSVSQQLYIGKMGAVVVQGGSSPRCWRL